MRVVGKKEVAVPYSKLRHAIADKLVAAGYIEAATQQGKKFKKDISRDFEV